MTDLASTSIRVVRASVQQGWPNEWETPLVTCIEGNLPWLHSLEGDDSTPLTTANALDNLRQQAPYVWLAVGNVFLNSTNQPTVFSASSLHPVAFGETAHLHGISATWLRETPYRKDVSHAIGLVTLAALETAFAELDCQRVMATVSLHNRGAKGFCWQWGFQKASESDTAAAYELTYPRYLAARGRLLNHYLAHPTLVETLP